MMKQPCSGPTWLDDRCQGSMVLAEKLFDELLAHGRRRSGSKHRWDVASAEVHREGYILTAELAQVLGALRDRADGTGGFISVDGSPLGSPVSQGCSAPANPQVGRAEFLGAMREVYGIVGRRAFEAALNGQMHLLSLDVESAITVTPCPVSSASELEARAVNRNILLQPPLRTIELADVSPCVTPTATPCHSVSSKNTPLCDRRSWMMRPAALCDESTEIEDGDLSAPSSGSSRAVTMPQLTPHLAPVTEVPDVLDVTRSGPWDLPPSGAADPSSSSTSDRERSKPRRHTVTHFAQMNALVRDHYSTPPSPIHFDGTGVLMAGIDGVPQIATAGPLHRACTDPFFGSAFGDSATSAASLVVSSTRSTRKRSSSSASHILHWHSPEETLIMFDWDDTLCPTTFIRGDSRLDWSEEAPFLSDATLPLDDPCKSLSRTTSSGLDSCGSVAPRCLAEVFRRHAETVSTVLRAAAACGRVAIITLAREGWVELSCKHFMPELSDVIQELRIEVVYARTMLTGWKLRCAMLDDLDLLLLMKKAAMRRTVKRFYARKNQSWKNTISIGDASTERDALTELVFHRSQKDKDGAEKVCRCKTVKLLEEPDVLQLTAELEVLMGWIQPMALYDGDVDADLSNSDESMATLEKMLQQTCLDGNVASPRE